MPACHIRNFKRVAIRKHKNAEVNDDMKVISNLIISKGKRLSCVVACRIRVF